MERYGSVRGAAVGFGLTYLLGFFMLGELLGSSADSTQSYTDHFDDDTARFGDIAGALALLAAAAFVVPVGLALRHELATSRPTLKVDLLAGLAVVSAAGILVSAGMLLAPPLWQSLGDVTDDPGMEPAVAAGVAQVGTAVLLCSLILLASWTFLAIHLTRKEGRVPGWLSVVGWGAAGLALLGITVVAALPLGLWWIGLGIFWRPGTTTER